MEPLSGFQSALRFLIELAALAGLGAGVHSWGDGWPGALRWMAVALVVVAAATAWAVFRVPGDTSAGADPVIAVPGALRLLLELALLLGAALALALAGRRGPGLALAAVVLFHYAATWSRVSWLLSR